VCGGGRYQCLSEINAVNVELILGISKIGTMEKSDFYRDLSEEEVGLLSPENSNAAA
jgi:hypothetical protein